MLEENSPPGDNQTAMSDSTTTDGIHNLTRQIDEEPKKKLTYTELLDQCVAETVNIGASHSFDSVLAYGRIIAKSRITLSLEGKSAFKASAENNRGYLHRIGLS